MGQLANHLNTFRTEYGRLCVLVAQATMQGYRPDAVITAAQGLGIPDTPIFVQIRQQRDRANRAWFTAKRAGVTSDMVVRIARDTRAVIAGEYMAELPEFKGATA